MSELYIESFIKNQLPSLPSHIIIDICDSLEHVYITDFFLSLKKSPVREVIIDHYFTKSIVLAIRRPSLALSGAKIAKEFFIHRVSSIAKFLDENPDVNPRQVTVVTRGDFRSFEAFIRQYQPRLSEKCDRICYELDWFELTIENLKLITTCLPNVHKLHLTRIVSLKCLNDLKQVGFTKMINLSELEISGRGVNWSSIKLPLELKSFTMSSCDTDVTTIVLPASIEHLSYASCNINGDILNRLQLPPSLKTLVLKNNDIGRVNLSCLPRTLQTLDLSCNGIANFSGDEQIEKKDTLWPPDLVTLSLGSNNLNNGTLRNLSSIGWPKSLKNLSLDDNMLTSLSNLYNVPDFLEFLSISKNDIHSLSTEEYTTRSDIYPYFRFPQFLYKLDLSFCQFKLERIEGSSRRLQFPETLSSLDLSFCKINDLSVFQFPSSLKVLKLTWNCITDLNSYNSGGGLNWRQMTRLAELELSSNRITDLSHWFPPPNIQKLTLSENRLTALTPEIPIFNIEFNHIYTKLQHLTLSPNPIKLIGPQFCVPPSIRTLNLRLPSLKKFHITSGVLNSNLHELDLSRARISASYFIEASRSDPRVLTPQPGYSPTPISHQDDDGIPDETHLFYDVLEASVGKKIRSRNGNVNSKHIFL